MHVYIHFQIFQIFQVLLASGSESYFTREWTRVSFQDPLRPHLCPSKRTVAVNHLLWPRTNFPNLPPGMAVPTVSVRRVPAGAETPPRPALMLRRKREVPFPLTPPMNRAFARPSTRGSGSGSPVLRMRPGSVGNPLMMSTQSARTSSSGMDSSSLADSTTDSVFRD